MSKTTTETKRIQIAVKIPAADGKTIAETVNVEVECEICPYTGEELLGSGALLKIEQTKARYMGILLPEQLRELRNSLGCTQKQMSELLNIGAKTYSRWETGRERPSRSLNLLLRALADGKLTPAYLRDLHKPVPRSWTPCKVTADTPYLYLIPSVPPPTGDQNAA